MSKKDCKNYEPIHYIELYNKAKIASKNLIKKMFTDELYCISAVGYWLTNNDNTKNIYIDLSSILTELIHSTGRFAENYASDLFNLWSNIQNIIDNTIIDKDNNLKINTNDNYFVFAIRENGVDDNKLFLSNIYNKDSQHFYRAIYILKIDIDRSEIRVSLNKVKLPEIYSSNFKLFKEATYRATQEFHRRTDIVFDLLDNFKDVIDEPRLKEEYWRKLTDTEFNRQWLDILKRYSENN